MPEKTQKQVTFEFDFEKALAALAYLASKTQNNQVTKFDKYKAGKLIFLADKYHLVKYGKPILGDEYRALPYGPVPQTTLDYLHKVEDDKPSSHSGTFTRRLLEALAVDRQWPNPRFSAKSDPNLDALSVSEIRALDHVIELHGKKDFEELKKLTHGPAYNKAWKAKPIGKRFAPMLYEDFFEGDPDAVDGACEEMLENNALRQALSAY